MVYENAENVLWFLYYILLFFVFMFGLSPNSGTITKFITLSQNGIIYEYTSVYEFEVI